KLIAPETEIDVWCDEEKMDIVFFNIISNAVKFSPRDSSILIRMEKEDGNIVVHIIDEGDGVAEDQLEAIFEPYYEGGNLQDKAFKGTGIGLALSKDIMTLHGGTIHAEINKERGMTFTISLMAGHAHFEPQDLLAENQTVHKEEQIGMPLDTVLTAERGEIEE